MRLQLEELEGDRVANRVLEGYRSTGFRRGIFFLLDPFLEATLQDPPLSAYLKRWNLPILDHTMQSSLRNFQYAGGFGKGQKSNRSVSLFHWFFAPKDHKSEQVICHLGHAS